MFHSISILEKDNYKNLKKDVIQVMWAKNEKENCNISEN